MSTHSYLKGPSGIDFLVVFLPFMQSINSQKFKMGALQRFKFIAITISFSVCITCLCNLTDCRVKYIILIIYSVMDIIALAMWLFPPLPAPPSAFKYTIVKCIYTAVRVNNIEHSKSSDHFQSLEKRNFKKAMMIM